MKEAKCRADELVAWLRADADAAEQFTDATLTESAAKEREAADLLEGLAQLVKPRIVTSAALIAAAVKSSSVVDQ